MSNEHKYEAIAVYGPFNLPQVGESYMIGFADPKTGRRRASAQAIRVEITSIENGIVYSHRINQGDGRKTIAQDMHTVQTYRLEGLVRNLSNGAAVEFGAFMNAAHARNAEAKAAKKLANKIATLESSINYFVTRIAELRESVANGTNFRTPERIAEDLKWYESKERSERRKLAKLLAQ